MVSYTDLLTRAKVDLSTAVLAWEAGDPNGTANRAYYAMFHAAQAALMSVGESRLALSKTHRGMISAFNLHLVGSGRFPAELGTLLGNGARTRLRADYDGEGVTNEEAEEMLASARRIIDAVAALPNPA